MASVNKVILIGNLGKDPFSKTLSNNTPMAAFSIATTRSFKAADGSKKSDTTWHSVLCYDGLAKIATDYLKKGQQVYIEGHLSNQVKTDAAGNKFTVTNIIADTITMLGSKPSEERSAPSSSSSNTPVSTPSGFGSEEPDDGIPY